MTFLYLPAFNAQLLVLPTTLSFDWGMDAIPRIRSWTDSRNLVSTVFYGGLLSLLLITANQHWTLRRHTLGKMTNQRINSAIKRRIQVQSSSVATAGPQKGSPADRQQPQRGVFCASPNELHKMSIVRNYLINGRGTNSISVFTNKRARRKRALFHGATVDAVTASPVPTTTYIRGNGDFVSSSDDAGQTLLSRLNGQTFGRMSSAKATTKIRSLTAYSGELGGCGDTSGSSTPTSTSSTYSSSSSCFSSSMAPVTSISHALPTGHAAKSEDRERKLPPVCVATLVAVAMLVLPFLPATNLFFYVGFVVAERILYLPSVGFCLCIGIGVDRLMRRSSSGGSGGGRGSVSKALGALFAATVGCLATRQSSRGNTSKSLNGTAKGDEAASGHMRSSNNGGSGVIRGSNMRGGKGAVGGGVMTPLAVNGGKCFIRQSCSRVSQIPRRVALMCTVILVLSTFSYRAVHRSFDWHDEESLYKSAIHVNPPKGKSLNMTRELCSETRILHHNDRRRRQRLRTKDLMWWV